MATLPKEDSSSLKRHSRHVSYNRPPLARRSTRGPLDAEDPLAADALPTPGKSPTEMPDGNIASSPMSLDPPNPEPKPRISEKDFSFLQRPEIYHPLTQLNIPVAFRTSTYQPSPATPLTTLFESSHFRSAAVSAAYQLCTATKISPSEIFSLFYTRLACLTLINDTSFAAEESKALDDLNSPFYFDEVTGLHLIPWELRVLGVRLQGIGYDDPRRGVLGYYDLARDARERVKGSIGKEREMWQHRLSDLGIRVGNALMEIGDLVGAARHFETLRSKQSDSDKPHLGKLAMLYLRLGDVTAARKCIEIRENTLAARLRDRILRPLLTMAEGRYEDAISEWRELQTHLKDELVTQNLAVCLLYAGRLEETTPLLTSLIAAGQSFHALTFNLVTVYELCTEKSRAKKMELVDTVAMIAEGRSGERDNADFKL